MIISRLAGGMGNQMFQYALGRSLAIKNNTTLGLDLAYLLDRTPAPGITFRDYNLDDFNIKAVLVSQQEVPVLYRKYNLGWAMRYIDFIRRKFIPTPGKEKKDYHFDPAILQLGPDSYLEGWWQNQGYFLEYQDSIRKDFTLKNPSEKASQLIKEIQSKNAVAVHIRRGDYLPGDYLGREYHPVLDHNYYEKALSIIAEKTSIECIYVFDRDDIEWCKQHVHFDYPTVYVENDISLAETVIAMSSCKHFVIANSSMSWWGAWLATFSEKIIIAPERWLGKVSVDYSDIIPETWIKI